MLGLKETTQCCYRGFVDTVRHDGIEHGGYLAFLSILSIFPFLVFFFALAGFLGQTDLGARLTRFFLENTFLPHNVTLALQPRVKEISSGPPQGLLTFAILGAIWTASSAVEGLRTILNRAYRVATPPAYILRRLSSIGQFLLLTSMMIAVMLILILIPYIWAKISRFVLYSSEIHDIFEHSIFSARVFWNYLRYALTLIILFIAVSVSYYTIPNIKQKWSATFPGASIVVLLWFIAGIGFSLYLENFNQVSIIYGSLGGFIAVLLFFYICAIIFIYGAEVNYHIERALGHKIKEKSPASSS